MQEEKTSFVFSRIPSSEADWSRNIRKITEVYASVIRYVAGLSAGNAG